NELPEGIEECVDLLVGADGDAQAFTIPVKPQRADRNAVLFQRPVERLDRLFPLDPDKVGMRCGDVEPESCELSFHAAACGKDLGLRLLKIGLVLQSSSCCDDGQGIAVIGV